MPKKIFQKNGSTVDRIESVTRSETKKGDECIIIKKTVIKAHAQSEHKVGDVVEHWLNSNTKSYQDDLRSFIACASGLEECDVDDAAIENAMLPSQPLAGVELGCKAWNVDTKQGNTWQKVVYGPRQATGKLPSPASKASDQSTPSASTLPVTTTSGKAPTSGSILNATLGDLADAMADRLADRLNKK